MSRRMIVLEIDAEDERCGECEGIWLNGYDADCGQSGLAGHGTRGPLCLAAESRYQRLVGAGEANASALTLEYGTPKVRAAWDAAVKGENA